MSATPPESPDIKYAVDITSNPPDPFLKTGKLTRILKERRLRVLGDIVYWKKETVEHALVIFATERDVTIALNVKLTTFDKSNAPQNKLIQVTRASAVLKQDEYRSLLLQRRKVPRPTIQPSYPKAKATLPGPSAPPGKPSNPYRALSGLTPLGISRKKKTKSKTQPLGFVATSTTSTSSQGQTNAASSELSNPPPTPTYPTASLTFDHDPPPPPIDPPPFIGPPPSTDPPAEVPLPIEIPHPIDLPLLTNDLSVDPPTVPLNSPAPNTLPGRGARKTQRIRSQLEFLESQLASSRAKEAESQQQTLYWKNLHGAVAKELVVAKDNLDKTNEVVRELKVRLDAREAERREAEDVEMLESAAARMGMDIEVLRDGAQSHESEAVRYVDVGVSVDGTNPIDDDIPRSSSITLDEERSRFQLRPCSDPPSNSDSEMTTTNSFSTAFFDHTNTPTRPKHKSIPNSDERAQKRQKITMDYHRDVVVPSTITQSPIPSLHQNRARKSATHDESRINVDSPTLSSRLTNPAYAAALLVELPALLKAYVTLNAAAVRALKGPKTVAT